MGGYDPHMKPIRKLIEKSVESDLAEAIEAKTAMRTKKQTEEDTTYDPGAGLRGRNSVHVSTREGDTYTAPSKDVYSPTPANHEA